MSTTFLFRSARLIPRFPFTSSSAASVVTPSSTAFQFPRHLCHSPFLLNSKTASSGSSSSSSGVGGGPPEQEPGDIHFKLTSSKHPLGEGITKKVTTSYWENPIPHPIYTKEELLQIQKTHHDPAKVKDRLALFAVKLMRNGFDFVSRYKGPGGEMTRNDWLNRCLFLEAIAGVPGK